MEFEQILHKIGGFGFFNKTIMMTVLVLGTWHTSLIFLSHFFILIPPPNQWCFLNHTWSGFPNLTTLVKGKCQMVTSLLDDDYANASFLRRDDVKCPSEWIYDKTEFFTTITMENQWMCSDSWKMYAVHSIYWLGSMSGYLISGFLADRIGRKKMILILTVIGGCANLAGTFFTELVGFMVTRYFTGMGSCTVCTAVFVVVMEYTIPERRTLIPFVWASSWAILSCVYPWYAYLLQSWRGLLLTNACMDVALLFVLYWVPESSRWLVSVGRNKEAVAILVRVSRINGKAVDKDCITELLQVSPPGTQIFSTSKEQDVSGFFKATLAIMRSRRIRKFTFLIYTAWFAISLCYNAGTLELGRLGLNIYTTFSIAVAFEFPVYIVCILAVDTLGRRWPNVFFMFTGGVVCLAMSLLRTESDLWTLVMAVMSIMSFAGGCSITYQLASEIFPTVIRARSVLLLRLVGDIGGLLGAQVTSLAEHDKYLPILVMGAVSLMASLLLFFLPDTVNHPMPQTMEDGENLARDQSLWFCPALAKRTSKKPLHLYQLCEGPPTCLGVPFASSVHEDGISGNLDKQESYLKLSDKADTDTEHTS
ncbi:solute carrier family 22 member 7 [Ixodes scapularis]|uniref:solute carrier family 22 member 7 n=1 Tax=Ixodes scapularis TaxID=6945 RepID=UPI001A9F4C06|nr:solute carrier family 22 member 7 [Ixodes scapularis]